MSVPVELKSWALRHHVSLEALSELAALLGAPAAAITDGTGSESRVQSQVRLVAPHRDMRLFRNNVGVLQDNTGRPVRYGLANDTKRLNEQLKSSDLIGWRRLVIRPEMVGCLVAQFVALETKKEGWRYVGDAHEQAQQRFIGLVAADGGYARFVTSADEVGV